VSRPVVADIATRLEGLGLTRRERDERDRRRVRMTLTERGRRVCAEASETPSAESVAAALDGLAGDERAALLRGLRALAEAGPA
jgi:DNA-binding MarR family transcriptional regulator